MPADTFHFTYGGQKYEASAEAQAEVNGFRRYKLAIPKVQSIVEGSVHMTETLEGDWVIEKIISADPVQEEFLHEIGQVFV